MEQVEDLGERDGQLCDTESVHILLDKQNGKEVVLKLVILIKNIQVLGIWVLPESWTGFDPWLTDT